MGESYKPITSMKEVPEQLRKLRRQYLRYQQAEIIYSISHKKLFELDGVELLFEEEALRAIAQQAQDQHTGARGLRGIMEDILTDLMFEAPSDPTIDKIIITEGVIKNGAAPQITRKKELLQTNSVKLTQKDAKKRQKRSTAS